MGLRAPYKLEAFKANLKTLAEAELFVSNLEDAYELARAGPGETSKVGQESKKKPWKKPSGGRSGGKWGSGKPQAGANTGPRASSSRQSGGDKNCPTKTVLKCDFCGKSGHTKANCFKRQRLELKRTVTAAVASALGSGRGEASGSMLHRTTPGSSHTPGKNE